MSIHMPEELRVLENDVGASDEATDVRGRPGFPKFLTNEGQRLVDIVVKTDARAARLTRIRREIEASHGDVDLDVEVSEGSVIDVADETMNGDLVLEDERTIKVAMSDQSSVRVRNLKNSVVREVKGLCFDVNISYRR